MTDSEQNQFISTEKLKELTRDHGSPAAFRIASFLQPGMELGYGTANYKYILLDNTIWKYAPQDWERVERQRLSLPEQNDGQANSFIKHIAGLADSDSAAVLFRAFGASARAAYVTQRLGIDFSDPKFDQYASMTLERIVGRAAQEIYFIEDLVEERYDFPYLGLLLSEEQLRQSISTTRFFRKQHRIQQSRRQFLGTAGVFTRGVIVTLALGGLTINGIDDILASGNEITEEKNDPAFDPLKADVSIDQAKIRSVEASITSASSEAAAANNSQSINSHKAQILELMTSSTRLEDQLVRDQERISQAKDKKYGDPDRKNDLGQLKAFAGALATLIGVIYTYSKVSELEEDFKIYRYNRKQP